jgi:hypothetical protein
MTSRHPGCNFVFETLSRYPLAAVAAVITIAVAGSAAAQNVPNQSGQRSAIGTGLGQQELPPGTTLEPRVEGAIQYANNINLAEDSDKQRNAAGIEFSPGFYAAHNSDRMLGAVDYSLITRLWDDGDLDDVSHRLAANGRLTAIPELFYIDADASYDDTVLDAGNGANYGGLGIFGQQNLAERAAASIRPTLQKRFKDYQFLASYSYGQVWFLDEGKGQDPTSIFVFNNEDSQDQAVNVDLRTLREGRKLNGRVFYEWQKSEFDRSLPYQFERTGLDGSWRLSRTLSLVGDVGLESDLDETTTEGGLDSEFWSTGLLWEPDTRSSAEARYGERFFGSSYSADVRHRARMLEFTASYSESPEVETRRTSLGSFEPGELPPWVGPGAGFGTLTSSPYVAKSTRASVSAKGSRTTLTLSGFDTQRDYLSELLGDEHGTGVAFRATRTLAANASVDFDVAYRDYERDPTFIDLVSLDATQDYDTQFVARGNRGFGPRMTASLEAGFLNRSGTQDYDGWWIGLRGRWIPALR